MVNKIPGSVRDQLDAMLRLGSAGDLSDGQLLDRVDASNGEPAEAAFAVLVERHGPMVLRVCRDAIGNPHDAEDACQAVFLVLARKAGSVRRRESAAGWLFGVARKVSSRARRDAARRREHERRKAELATQWLLDATQSESWDELHEEIDRLPEVYRSAVVLCHLEGLTHEEAATRLHCPLRTLQSRLLRARSRLKVRLARRGVAPSAMLGLRASTSPLTAKFAGATVRIALSGSAGMVPAAVSSLVVGLIDMPFHFKLIPAGAALMAVGVMAGLAWAAGSGRGARSEVAATVEATSPEAREVVDDPVDPPGKIHARGVLVDEEGRPVAGAEVLAEPFTERETRGLSGADGTFSVPLLTDRIDGAELLARSADGGTRGTFRYDLVPARGNYEDSGRIVLKPARKVAVRVVDATKAPVPDALVRVISSFQIVDGGTTDAKGVANLSIPADSSIESMIALKPGRGFDYAEFGPIDGFRRSQGGVPASEVPATVTLSIDSARPVQVKAVDLDGKPLAGVEFSPWLVHKEGRLAAINLPNSRIFASTTDAQGVAAFDWLPPSGDAITFWPRTEGYAYRRVILEEGASGPVIARLTRTETIRGRVVRPDGSPAPGIRIHATGTGKGFDTGFGRGTTALDGSYVLNVSPGEFYAVYIDNKDWTARPRFDIIVRRGYPVTAIDFALTKGTVILGKVTVGPDNVPAPGRYIGLRQSGGRALAELLDEGARIGPELDRYLNAKSNAEGRYSFRVTPGDYLLISPTREETEELTVEDESRIVRDFRISETEPGRVSGRIVDGASGNGLAGAKVAIVPMIRGSVPLNVTADAGGNFQAARKQYRLVIHASGHDGKLGAILDVDAEVADVVIPLAPTATATGLLLDEDSKPVANRKLDWGRRVFTGEINKGQSMTCFAANVSTDGEGRFTLPSLVVGQNYEIGLRKGNRRYEVGAVCPKAPDPVDLGTLRALGFRP